MPAAYTNVDRAETETSAAWRANAHGPAVLASACAGAEVPLLHISTDYVFDGTKAGAYRESDPISYATGGEDFAWDNEHRGRVCGEDHEPETHLIPLDF
jgi:hypothetical protein